MYLYLNISISFKRQYITILSDGSEDEDVERGAQNLSASPSENDAKQHTNIRSFYEFSKFVSCRSIT